MVKNSYPSANCPTPAACNKPSYIRNATLASSLDPFSLVLPIFLPIQGRMTITPHTKNSLTFSSLRTLSSPLDQTLESRESFYYQILWGKAPVFVLGIKTRPKLGLISAREEADFQIRRHLRDLWGTCPLPKLSRPLVQLAPNCVFTPRIVADDQ